MGFAHAAHMTKLSAQLEEPELSAKAPGTNDALCMAANAVVTAPTIK